MSNATPIPPNTVLRDIEALDIKVPMKHAIRMCQGFNAALNDAFTSAAEDGVTITSINMVVLRDHNTSKVGLRCQTIGTITPP